MHIHIYIYIYVHVHVHVHTHIHIHIHTHIHIAVSLWHVGALRIKQQAHAEGGTRRMIARRSEQGGAYHTILHDTIYIYIYTHNHIYIYIYICICIYVYTCVCVYIYIYIYNRIYQNNRQDLAPKDFVQKLWHRNKHVHVTIAQHFGCVTTARRLEGEAPWC